MCDINQLCPRASPHHSSGVLWKLLSRNNFLQHKIMQFGEWGWREQVLVTKMNGFSASTGLGGSLSPREWTSYQRNYSEIMQRSLCLHIFPAFLVPNLILPPLGSHGTMDLPLQIFTQTLYCKDYFLHLSSLLKCCNFIIKIMRCCWTACKWIGQPLITNIWSKMSIIAKVEISTIRLRFQLLFTPIKTEQQSPNLSY